MALTIQQYIQLSFGYLCGADLLRWGPPPFLIKQYNVDSSNPQDACDTAYNEIIAELGTRYDFTYELAKVGYTPAVVTAIIGGNALTGFTIINPGSGYILPPVVNLSGGGGTGATATAILGDNGSIEGFDITTPGSGYTSAPAVTLSIVPFVPASCVAVLLNGALSAITIISGGSGYEQPPTVKIIGGSGSGAIAEAILTGGVITGFKILAPGCNYTSTPNVMLYGGQSTDSRDPLLVKLLSLFAVRNALGNFENISEKMLDDFKWADKKVMAIRNGQSNLAISVQASSVLQTTGPASNAEMVGSSFSTLG